MRLLNKKEVQKRIEEMIKFYNKERELFIEEMENWVRQGAHPSNFLKRVLEIIKPTKLAEVQGLIELLTDFWNVTPRKELNDYSPIEITSLEGIAKVPYSEDDVGNNFFLLDVEAFLDYVSKNSPLKLTEKGGLKRESLLEIAEILKDPDFKKSHQEFLKIFKAFNEENIPYIQRLRYICEFLRLIRMKNKKLFINKANYEKFCSSPQNLKFDLVFQAHLGPINWAYFHPYGEPNFAEVIQGNQTKLWTFLNFYLKDYRGKWIPFNLFSDDILKEFDVGIKEEEKFSKKLDVKYVLIMSILKLFSLVELKEDRELEAFKFTSLAEKIIPRQIKLTETYNKVYKQH